MKTVSAIILSLTLVAASLAEEKPLKERAADAAETIKRDSKQAADSTVDALKDAWKTTKAYLSQDPAEYRTGAMKKLESFAGDISTLGLDAQKEPLLNRNYFQTRVKALREHLEYARSEFAKLPGNKDQKDYEAARRHFNRTLQTLEDAIGQARSEASSET